MTLIFPFAQVTSGMCRRKSGVSVPLAEPQVKVASFRRTRPSVSASICSAVAMVAVVPSENSSIISLY